jgi:rubrerythrin
MSSLFGAITSSKKEITAEQIIKRNQIVRGLAVYSESAGSEATGIGLVSKDNKYAYLKQAIGASKFFQTKEYKEFMLEYSPLIILGHTKIFSYSEGNSGENAHPFLKGTIMGCHVGSLNDFEKIDSKAEVDSEAIFTLLDKEKNDYKKAFAEMEGSFALSWVDGLTLDKVFIGKKDMPLYLSFSPELKTYFWSSSEEPFASLYEVVGVKNFDTFEVKRNTVYEIGTNLKSIKREVSFKSTIADETQPDYSGSCDRSGWFKETEWEKKEREEKEAVEKLIYPESFTKDLTKIQKKFVGGCEMCKLKIDITSLGFYWNKGEEFIVCPSCTNLFKKDDWKLFDFITTASLLKKVGTQQTALVAL